MGVFGFVKWMVLEKIQGTIKMQPPPSETVTQRLRQRAEHFTDFSVKTDVGAYYYDMFLSKTKMKTAWVQSALERFERPLLQYALSILHDLDRARDTVQETFMRLHTQDQAAIEDHLSQWLFTVCRNCALKSLKKESRYISVEAQEFEHHVVENVSPLQAMARRETIERLMEHVKELPKNKQEVVRLRFHGGHSYDEISKITGLTPGNVGFILNASMRDLRERMERDEQDEKMIYLTKHVA